jgi:hypothetical protein
MLLDHDVIPTRHRMSSTMRPLWAARNADVTIWRQTAWSVCAWRGRANKKRTAIETNATIRPKIQEVAELSPSLAVLSSEISLPPSSPWAALTHAPATPKHFADSPTEVVDSAVAVDRAVPRVFASARPAAVAAQENGV